MRGIALAILFTVGLPTVSVHAAGHQVEWPTFFRAGPSRHNQVVAELSRGTLVDVRSCDDQWCLVQYGRTLGYVERGMLNANASPTQHASPSSYCFDSVRSGYGKGEDFRFCPR